MSNIFHKIIDENTILYYLTSGNNYENFSEIYKEYILFYSRKSSSGFYMAKFIYR
jgi:hypothetical protein